MSWSYGQQVMAHEAAPAAMRNRENGHNHRDPNVPPTPWGRCSYSSTRAAIRAPRQEPSQGKESRR